MRTTTGGLRSFLGGLNVPGAGRGWPARFNATVPLARLRVDADGVELRCVGPLRRLPGWAAERREVAACFRLRPVPPLVFGVGFEGADGAVAYFWTLRSRAVLRALGELGYPEAEPRWARLRHVFGLGR